MKELSYFTNDHITLSTFSWGINDFLTQAVKGNKEHTWVSVEGRELDERIKRVSEYRSEGFLFHCLA